MKFLADENIEGEIVFALRECGYSVADVREISPGIDDLGVLRLATELGAILLTSDKDFGDLVYRNRSVSSGIILLRLGKLSAREKIEILLEILVERETEMKDSFTVITSAGVRIRQ